MIKSGIIFSASNDYFNPRSLNGSNQALITAGTTSGGTMVYAVGSSSGPVGDFSASIPDKKDVDSYYVRYKASGTNFHPDSEASYRKQKMKQY